MRFILLGAIGSGKGTQGKMLKEKYNLPTISTGELLRESIERKEPNGLEAYKYMSKGNLVPDEIVITILQERLNKPDCKNGYVIDGFPRNISQAKALDKIVKLDKVFLIDVKREELVRRSIGRRMCPKCGEISHLDWLKGKDVCSKCNTKLVIREDDKPEQIERRLVTMDPTPVANYYKEHNMLAVIDGNMDKDKIFEQISKVIKKYEY